MRIRSLLGTFLLLAGTFLAGRIAVAILTGTRLHPDAALHVIVVPAVQTALLASLRAVRSRTP